MNIKEVMSQLYSEAMIWCQNKNWQIRLPLLVWFTYVLIRHLSDPMYGSVIAPLNLGIHELGHLVLSFFGTFIQVTGGTLFQLLAPVISIANFYRQGDFFAITLCFGWLSTSLFDVARYVADASKMELPLAVPFGFDAETVIHDWNYILTRLGLLHHEDFLAFILRLAATIAMLVCLGLGARLLWEMRKSNAISSQTRDT